MKVKKYKNCKHLDADIWGGVLGKGKITRLTLSMQQEYLERRTKRAVYTLYVSKVKRRKRLSLFGKILYNRRKICLFYGNMTRKTYKKICEKALQKGGNFGQNMVEILESRLETLVHRMHFTSNILESKNLIRQGAFLVNKEVIKNPGFLVKVGDIVEVVESSKKDVLNRINYRALVQEMYVGVLKNCEVNYRALVGYKIKDLDLQEVIYPFVISKNFFVEEYFSRIR